MATNNYKYRKSLKIDWLKNIPIHWEEVRLGSLFNQRKEKVSDTDYPPLSVTKNGVVPQLANAAKSNDGSNRKLVLKGDFAINSRSDRKGSSGVSIYDGSVSLIYIILKPFKIEPRYSEYLLKSYYFKEEYYRYGRGIVEDLWTTRYSEMKNMVIPSAPIEEQTTIANFLDYKLEKIDRFINKKKQLITLLKEQKAAVINQAVTKGLDKNATMKPSGIEWLGDIPECWEVKKLKYCIVGRLKYGANEPGGDLQENDPRYIRITDFDKSGNLRKDTFCSLKSELAKPYLLQDGDVLFARSGGTVGKTFQFKNYDGEACFAGYLIKAEPNPIIITSDFLFQYTNSGAYEHWKGFIFNKATIENIGADKYNILPVIVPPLSEQQQIVDYIEIETTKIAKTITTIEKEITLVEEYKTALIAEAVTGKIDVREWSKP